MTADKKSLLTQRQLAPKEDKILDFQRGALFSGVSYAN